MGLCLDSWEGDVTESSSYLGSRYRTGDGSTCSQKRNATAGFMGEKEMMRCVPGQWNREDDARWYCAQVEMRLPASCSDSSHRCRFVPETIRAVTMDTTGPDAVGQVRRCIMPLSFSVF